MGTHDDEEEAEINCIGDDFQCMQNTTALFLYLGDPQESKHEESVCTMYPALPKEEYYILKEKVSDSLEILKVVRHYLRVTAARGFMAVICLLGEEMREGRFRFPSGQIITLNDLEHQVRLTLGNNSDHITPQVVDIVSPLSASALKVTTMKYVGSETCIVTESLNEHHY
jgi:hypothetical protein